MQKGKVLVHVKYLGQTSIGLLLCAKQLSRLLKDPVHVIYVPNMPETMIIRDTGKNT